MQGIEPSVLVFIILATVTVAAYLYKPQQYPGQWQNLAARYETARRPLKVTFRGEPVAAGGILAEYAKFDVEPDDDGLWLLYDGPKPAKCPECLLIPWSAIKLSREHGDKMYFAIKADAAVQITVGKTLGGQVTRRCSSL